MFAGLHKGKEALDKAKEDFGREARLLREVGAEYLVHLPDAVHRHARRRADRVRRASTPSSGRTWSRARTSWRATCSRSTASSWCSTRTPTPTSTPRSGSSGSSPTPTRELVNLCLDTGHIAYCDGDNVEIIERFPERITYVHLKQVDPEVRERVRREKLSLAEAVPLGVMCEPPYGEPDMPPLLDALAKLDRDIYMRHRAGPLPRRAAHPAADPGPRRRLHALAAGWAPSGAGPTDLFSLS